MFGGFCGTANSFWGYSGNFAVWNWIGFILNLVFWVGLIAGLILFVVWALRDARVPTVNTQLTAKEILQAKYAQGEISREQYELMKQDIR
jgi:putative membrane protein